MNWNYLFTFCQTCALEYPFYAAFLGFNQGRWLSSLAATLALNAFTHPLVFFVMMSAKTTLLGSIFFGEVFAFGFEAWACAFFFRLPARRALAAATLANLASWQLGPLLTYWIFF